MNIKHTGIVVSAKDADAWHATIRQVMAERRCTFEQAVDLYIRARSGPPAEFVLA